MDTITITDTAQLSDTEKARQLKRQNPSMTAKEIAARIGRKATYVYAALRFAKDIPHPKRGRPRKAKKVVKPVTSPAKVADGILPPNPLLRNPSYDRIRKLEAQIVQYRTVISYLEHQLGLKDSQNGSSV